MSQDGDRVVRVAPTPADPRHVAVDRRGNRRPPQRRIAGRQLQGRRQLLLRTERGRGWPGSSSSGQALAGSEPRSDSPTAGMTCWWSSAILPRRRRTATTRSRSGTGRTSPSSVRPTPSPPVRATCLAKYAPAVLDRLRDDGIEEINFFKLLAPPELHRPEDDEFTGLLSRRPAFELALRLTAEEHPRVEIRCPALVTGLLHRDDCDRCADRRRPARRRSRRTR